MKELRLSDNTISQIAKTLQLAILTGTDVIDHFRMFRLAESEDEPGTLTLTKEFLEQSDENIQKMLDEIQNKQES